MRCHRNSGCSITAIAVSIGIAATAIAIAFAVRVRVVGVIVDVGDIASSSANACQF